MALRGGGGNASAAVELMDEGSRRIFEATSAELLAVQPEVFWCLYNADQTPVQAQTPVAYTLDKAERQRSYDRNRRWACVRLLVRGKTTTREHNTTLLDKVRVKNRLVGWDLCTIFIHNDCV